MRIAEQNALTSRSLLSSRLAAFGRNQRGSISVMTVASMVPFMIAAGIAIDMGRINRTTDHMQKAVDSAALAGAATKGDLTSADGEPLSGEAAKIYAANKMVDANLPDQVKKSAKAPGITVTGDEITVSLDADMPTSLMHLMGIETVALSVVAVAKAELDASGCIVALGANGDGIEVGGTVKVDIEGCWLYSNKEGDKSINVVGTATIDAGGSCSAGSTSVSNNATVFDTRQTYCTPLPDPMADWTPPEDPVDCDHNDFNQSASTVKDIILYPGSYCGGLRVSGYDNVHFEPGIYQVSGGPLTINSKATVTGEEVGFHLSSDVTAVTINGASEVTLSAPTDGDMEGKLIAMEPLPDGAEPTKDDLISAKINGGADLGLAGTIYLPTSTLDIAGNSTTLSSAAQIIAYSVKLSGTSELSLKVQVDEYGNPIGGSFASAIRLIK